MANRYDDLDKYVDLGRMSERWHKPGEFEGITLILKDASNRTGTRGEYFVIGCEIEDTGEMIYISTGASQPMMAISAWKAAGSKPVRFTFAREGDRTLMVKPSESSQPL